MEKYFIITYRTPYHFGYRRFKTCAWYISHKILNDIMGKDFEIVSIIEVSEQEYKDFES